MGSKYLKLKPGNDHSIRVRREFYRTAREKDRIFLERTYLGETMKGRKISSRFLEGIKVEKCCKK